MSSSVLTTCPQLPPTTNFLDSQQRLRLIRSTRKLGAVLGTTPYILENETSFALLPLGKTTLGKTTLGKTTSKALKRQGSIFTHYQSSSLSLASNSTSTTSSHRPSSSTSSLNLPRSAASTESLPSNPPGLSTTRRRRQGDKAPHLYLRLDMVPVSPTDHRVTSPLPPTACTSAPLTPITPHVPDVAEVRRKRVAKLVRHLGEDIPTELVLAPESAPEPTLRPPTTSPSCRVKRRSQSVHVMSTDAARLSNIRPPLVRPQQDWVGEWNRPNIKDVQRELRNLRVK